MTCTTPCLAVILVRYEIFDLLHLDVLSYSILNDFTMTVALTDLIMEYPCHQMALALVFFSMASVDPLHHNDTETQIEG